MGGRTSLLCPVIAVSLLASLVSADTMAFKETWSDDGDLEGWYAWAGELTLTHNDVMDTLAWGASQGLLVDVIAADSAASGGAFVGDLRPFEGYSFAFDLLIDVGSDVGWLTIAMANTGVTDEWDALLTLPTQGVWTHFEVPLVEASWIHNGGSSAWADFLGDVAIVGVGVASGWQTGSASGQLDNFEITPEPASALVLALGLLPLLKRRRRK